MAAFVARWFVCFLSGEERSKGFHNEVLHIEHVLKELWIGLVQRLFELPAVSIEMT